MISSKEAPKMHNGFSQRLLEVRKQRGLKQSTLANMASLHTNQIGRYERGESQPTADALQQLAKALDVSVGYLMDGAEDPLPPSKANTDQKLSVQFKEIQGLPTKDKEIIGEFLDAFLTKRKLQELVAK